MYPEKVISFVNGVLVNNLGLIIRNQKDVNLSKYDELEFTKN